MKKNEKKSEVRQTFPSREEIKAAQLACCGRCCTQCETPAEYAWRKRDVDMALLLERAIKNELTDVERETVTEHWFNFETVTAIADKRGINPSAVNRTLARAEEKLERVLSYAVCYQLNLKNESIIPVALGRARVIAAARNASGGTVGDRVTGLRQAQNVTRDILAPALGITSERLGRIEHGAEPTSSEIAALSSFFNVTADFILRGELNE